MPASSRIVSWLSECSPIAPSGGCHWTPQLPSSSDLLSTIANLTRSRVRGTCRSGRSGVITRRMIKNALMVMVVVGGGGCAHEEVPPGYQGVVELDERQLAFEVGGRVTTVTAQRG